MICLDCQKESDTKVCLPCLKLRRSCANRKCTSKINTVSTWKYCFQCTCSVVGCEEPRTAHTKFCKDCINKWDVTCHICQTAKTQIPFRTCEACNTKKHAGCTFCGEMVFFDNATRTYAKLCFACKCKTRNCGEQREASGHCKICMSCFCTSCKKKFAESRSTLCVECKQKEECSTCSVKGCNQKVKWSHYFKEPLLFCENCACVNKRCRLEKKYDETGLCDKCVPCAAENCNLAINPHHKSNFCATCEYEYSKFEKVKCIQSGCKLYTESSNSLCDAH